MKGMNLAAALGCAALIAPMTAAAQTAQGGVDTPGAPNDPAEDATPPEQPNVTGDIVVTANRRQQTALTVPIAISAVSGDGLAAKGVVNSADLQEAVPNLQISSPYGNTQPNFSLRGISVANEYNSNQASPIGVYIDDVYLANRTAHGMGLFDLDRVEVLRGPQGTLFGRNTTGGAINFITKAPSLSGNSGFAEAGYGNYNTWTGQAALELTMVEDQLGLRVSGNLVNGDGRVRNVFPGGLDPYSQDTLQGRATLRIRPGGGPLDIKIKIYGGRDRGTQAAVHGLQAFRTGLDFFETNENRVGRNRTEAYGISANVTYDFGDGLSFTSITSRDGGAQNLGQAADGAPVDILDIVWISNYDQLSEEARLNYSKGKLNLVGGYFYGRDVVKTRNDLTIAGAIPPGLSGGFFQEYRQVRRSNAVFAQGDYEVARGLTLTLGARYTWDRAEYNDGFAYLFLGGVDDPRLPLATTVPCATPAGTCPYDPNARYEIRGANNALTGRVSLAYQFDGGPLLYASYNRGYRSGAFNGGGYTGSAGITYIRPEQVNAYEVGLKGKFIDDRLTLTASGFYYDYKNQQLQDLRENAVAVLVNAPKSEIYGAEVEAVLRPADWLTINASGGYLHTEYEELTLKGIDLSGNRLPFAPEFTAQGGFDLSLYRSDDGALVFTPSVAYFSQQWFSPFNGTNAPASGQINAELQQRAYAKVNAQIAWTIGNITFKGFVDNVFDQQNYVYGLDLRASGFPYNFLVPSLPRTYGGSVRIVF